MTRNLKALGLALVAVFAMSAIAATAAQAEPTLTAAKYPVTLTAKQITPQVYKTGSLTLECLKFSGHGTIKEKGVGDTRVTATGIHYEECAGSAGTKVTVDMTECDYVFHGGTATEVHHYTGATVDLVCPEGKHIDVKIWLSAARHTANPTKPDCTITVFPFTNHGEITYTNTTGTTDDVDVKAINVSTPIEMDKEAGGILCPSVEATAVYNGEVTLTGEEDASPFNPVGVTISG